MLSLSTPTMKMAQTAVKTSPIGHCHSSERITEIDTITKWDIFHYTYGLLHHPEYREKYQENLKRDLPHIAFAEDFWSFVNAGARLTDLHVNYESQPEYDKLNPIETLGMQVYLSVDRMKFSKDKTRSEIQRLPHVRRHPCGSV